MENPFKQIAKLLNEQKISYRVLEHEPVYTSEQAARIRGLSSSQGAKALLLKADDKFILAVLPGSLKLDSKKLKQFLSIKNLRFATPQEVEQMMGCQIGACYPFGSLLSIPTYVDPKLGNNETIAFNAGLHHKSIIMQYEDYIKAVNPVMVNLSQ